MTLDTPDQKTYSDERMARKVLCTLRYDLEKMAPHRKKIVRVSAGWGAPIPYKEHGAMSDHKTIHHRI